MFEDVRRRVVHDDGGDVLGRVLAVVEVRGELALVQIRYVRYFQHCK